jgi:hypothetical protein
MGAGVFHAEGMTDGVHESNSIFSQFFESAKKKAKQFQLKKHMK